MWNDTKKCTSPNGLQARKNHVEVLVGYAYDEELGKQMVICHDSAYNNREMFHFSEIDKEVAITFMKVK